MDRVREIGETIDGFTGPDYRARFNCDAPGCRNVQYTVEVGSRRRGYSLVLASYHCRHHTDTKQADRNVRRMHREFERAKAEAKARYYGK